MSSAWLCAILFVVLPFQQSENLSIESKDEEIITIDRADYTIPLPNIPLVHIEKFTQLLEELDRATYIAPQNAYIDSTGKVIEAKLGSRLHRRAFTDIFYSYFYHDKPSKIQAPMLPIHPRVDRDLLLHIQVKQIGNYITFFNEGNEARSHNIALAAEAINNQVVFPGEAFSFNRVVGKRTKDRGYMRAPVIVRGELAEDIGGGICQVSSTLYNAADRAGLKIIERYSHSKIVPYVPTGRDAAVSWYGPDFSFKNEYSFPLLIRAAAMEGKMIIRIFSSDEIEYEPRFVPGASKALPEEIPSAREDG